MGEEMETMSGFLILKELELGEACLCLDSPDVPLVDELQHLTKNVVSARYWVSDKKCTKEEANELFIKKLHGCLEAKFCINYSELTGYLWTDEELKIGGHDLLEELKSYVGKFLVLEIKIHNDKG